MLPEGSPSPERGACSSSGRSGFECLERIPPPVFIPVGRRVPNTKWIRPARPRNKRRCPFQPAESFLARARAPPAARSDSVDVRARRPSPLHPAGPCSATPPALRLLPCAPLDVGRKDRFPLGTRLREDRARVVNAARARSPFPGTPVAVAWDPRLKTAQQRASARCSSSRRRSAHRDKLGAAVLAAAAAAAASPLASVTAALHLAAASL